MFNLLKLWLFYNSLMIIILNIDGGNDNCEGLIFYFLVLFLLIIKSMLGKKKKNLFLVVKWELNYDTE